MAHDYVTLETATMDTPTAYRLLVGAVVPRPIAWITTKSLDGVVNAAPFSSYNYVAHSPPMVAVNIGTRDGELKDTARNIMQTREFVVNVATLEIMETMHGTSAEFPPEASETEAGNIVGGFVADGQSADRRRQRDGEANEVGPSPSTPSTPLPRPLTADDEKFAWLMNTGKRNS